MPDPDRLRSLVGERHFRWRGGSVSRLEALADAVFAISLTFLIVTLEVPKNIADIRSLFPQIPVFLICFALLVLLWFFHYQFHRRFGLEDGWTVLWNMLFLFVVLIYIYPLRFLFTLLFEEMLGLGDSLRRANAGGLIIDRRDWPMLMVFYSGGVTVVWLLLGLMNAHALRRAEALELDAVERLQTRSAVVAHLLSAAVGVASIGLALLGSVSASGMIYFAMGPMHAGYGMWIGSRVERLARAQRAAGP